MSSAAATTDDSIPSTGERPRVLSGIQPTFQLHLGNYLGALRNWAEEQEKYDNFFCIVDLHALTTLPDPAMVRSSVLELAALFIASGLDPDRNVLFVQSHVAAHTQLSWILECHTPLGWLERMTQFKSKGGSGPDRERAAAGLLTYPTLMAADILLYDAEYVPVGDDQRQHVEVTRDIAQRFNSLRGEVFRLPQPLIRSTGARVMGLDDPTAKMSKTTARTKPAHAILLLDPPDTVSKKIARATTDTNPEVAEPLGPGVANLIDIHAALQGMTHQQAVAQFTGKSYGNLKRAVTDSINETLAPMQAKYMVIRGDEPWLLAMLAEGAERAAPVADATLQRAQRAVGLR
ncbi:MAG TPA: tryptophan--tRNA ligase [Candidatus Dormibacteraeota bacterium]|nr:tryptophan--tRNA ligase [Candidatus Dormibacteraeota bacterium]